MTSFCKLSVSLTFQRAGNPTRWLNRNNIAKKCRIPLGVAQSCLFPGYLRWISIISHLRWGLQPKPSQGKKNILTIQVIRPQSWRSAPGKVVKRRLGDRQEAADKDRVRLHKWITLCFLHLKQQLVTWNKLHYIQLFNNLSKNIY